MRKIIFVLNVGPIEKKLFELQCTTKKKFNKTFQVVVIQNITTKLNVLQNYMLCYSKKTKFK